MSNPSHGLYDVFTRDDPWLDALAPTYGVVTAPALAGRLADR